MTQKINLRPHRTPDEIARAAAIDLVELLKNRAGLPFGMALSGGRIAKAFYEAIVTASSELSFTDVHFFWTDERCVPPSDPENNYSIALEHLFRPLRIPPEQIHRIRGEVDADYAVKEAEAELCRLMPMCDSGQPILDLIILGMGEDGHVASLFPQEGSSFVEDTRVFRKVFATKPPPERITLGYQPIIVARHVWVLASGRGKFDAFQRLMRLDDSLPISRVVARRPATTLFHDIQS